MPNTPAPVKDLGPVIVEKRLSKGGGVFFLIFGLVCVGGGVALLSDSAGMGVGSIVMGIGLVLLSIVMMTKRYEIRQNGIVARSMFGTNEVAFSDVRTIGYGFFVAKSNKRVSMKLIPKAGKPLTVSLGIPLRQADEPDLAAVRDRLVERISATMADTLQKRASVEWIQKGTLGVMSFPSLNITRDGFMIDDGKTKSNILRGEVDVAFNNGYLFVTRKMDRKAIFKCPGMTPNVYPGLRSSRVRVSHRQRYGEFQVFDMI